MAYRYEIRRHVAFSETDAGGIAHFSNFFKYMEDTEHAFLRSLGFSVVTSIDGRAYAWPRVHARCDYLRPLRFEEAFDVTLLVRAVRRRVVDYLFVFKKVDAPAGEEIAAKGGLTAVCTQQDQSGQMRAVAIPGPIASKLEAAPAEVLAEIEPKGVDESDAER